ncbi:unnamed protein product [Hymenolepis diminuta]|uniref:Uncharacterized protein n=1 Tax=Hymenolepis diminuta TaxID=6216 RepID=A0A564YNB4_HYMDI|nr:unnamed protein product [Hymenolepis diminuta]
MPDIHLAPPTLTISRGFALYSISIVNVSGINLNDFTSSFSEDTIKNLHTLNLTRLPIEKKTKLPAITALEQLQNLQFLIINCTALDTECLNILVEKLRLNYLDIIRNQDYRYKLLDGAEK